MELERDGKRGKHRQRRREWAKGMAEWKERCEWQNGCGTMEGETGRGTSGVVI